ncbi:MAG: hypothetical protein WDA47_04645 [Bacilli bacterium]
MTTYAKSLFDQAVRITPGQSVLVKCQTKGRMNSLRVLLARERKRFMAVAQPDFDLSIRTKIDVSGFYVIIDKIPPMPAPVVIDQAGNIVEELAPEQESISTPDTFLLDTDRQIALMREDGMTEQEIAAYFQEETIPDEPEDLSVD